MKGGKPSGETPRPFSPRELEGANAPARQAGEPGDIRAFRLTDLDGPAPARGVSAGPGGTASAPPLPGEAELEAARGEAAALLDRARAEAEQLRSAARSEGLEAGRAEGRARLQEAATRLESAAREIASRKDALYDEARGQVVELVLALVGRVLGPLAEADTEAVVRVAERALQLLSDRERLTIRVHPEDLKALIEAKPTILETFDGIQKLTVLEDRSVRRGGCLVQTPTTEIDARLETQLQELCRSVRNA